MRTVGEALAIMQEASFDHHKAKNSGDRGDHHRVKPPGPTTAGAGAVATRVLIIFFEKHEW